MLQWRGFFSQQQLLNLSENASHTNPKMRRKQIDKLLHYL